jgi:hypothetical protein
MGVGGWSGSAWQAMPRNWRRLHSIARGAMPATAGERIDRFRTQAREALEEATTLLDSEDAPSDAWFGVAERLQAACWRVGSATYCLREWREPDDARPDVDDRCNPGDERLDADELGRVRNRRAGRRGVALAGARPTGLTNCLRPYCR